MLRLYQVITVLVLMVVELLDVVPTQPQFCGISAMVVTWMKYQSASFLDDVGLPLGQEQK